jgi:acylphosphatase
MTYTSRVHPSLGRISAFVAAVFMCALAMNAPVRAKSNKNDQSVIAVSGTVTGKVQKVGFRALIQKQAIEYNLAGSTKNNDDGSVQFLLQGDADRIDEALVVIRKGPERARHVKVNTSTVPIDPSLKRFTAIDWTSQSRHICNPYSLVFDLRGDNTTISKHDAKDVWLKICEKTVRGDDIGKCDKDDLTPEERGPACPNAD